MAPRPVTFAYRRSTEYRLVAITGAYGGPMPAGLVKMDLFVEYGTTPDSIQYERHDDGKLEEVSRTPSEQVIIRDVQAGVVMTIDAAENIGRWLLEKAQQSRELVAKRSAAKK